MLVLKDLVFRGLAFVNTQFLLCLNFNQIISLFLFLDWRWLRLAKDAERGLDFDASAGFVDRGLIEAGLLSRQLVVGKELF